jgi:astacin (peptidase family M12A)
MRQIISILFSFFVATPVAYSQTEIPHTLGKRKKIQAPTEAHTAAYVAQTQKMKFKLPFSLAEKEYWVQKMGHFYVLNGDIIVGNDFPKTMGLTINDADFRWPDGTIPIAIDPSIYTNNLGSAVHAAIKEFNTRSELCLTPRNLEKDYIKIVFSSSIAGAGLSAVGHQGGEQQLFLNSSASTGTVIHELLHAAGFYHEQCRSDRDKFVKINAENIQDGLENNFQMEGDAAPSGGYDYCSVMHYSSTAFSKNGQPTIECVQNNEVVSCPSCLGNRSGFSDQDIKSMDWLYSNISRFPCQTPFPDPNYQPMRFPNTYPSANDAAMQSFRYRADIAAKEGFVGAYPNFHTARKGIDEVGGTIFIKSSGALWQDVYLSSLGNPSLNDFGARMRATQEYATRNGFVGGFPNFYHADNGKGIVCGTILLTNTAAEWRDVPSRELGNPPLDDIGARMRSANDYAFRNGYLGGFPTFFHADYGKGIVCGIIMIKKEAAEWRDVIIFQGPR